PTADAENVLLWGGLNFGLGAFALGAASRAGRGARLAGKADDAAAELDDVARAAEARATAGGAGVVDDVAPTASPVDLSGQSLHDLGADAGMRPDDLERIRADEGFRASGVLETPNPLDARDGISVSLDQESGRAFLQDGRHRLTVARE